MTGAEPFCPKCGVYLSPNVFGIFDYDDHPCFKDKDFWDNFWKETLSPKFLEENVLSDVVEDVQLSDNK
jgi:hypothetical protein